MSPLFAKTILLFADGIDGKTGMTSNHGLHMVYTFWVL
jgi:hypothetical protein